MQRENPEVDAFYHSTGWKKLRATYYKAKLGLCERCGRTGSKMVVHHKEHVTAQNINDADVTLN